jgi:uncharacterized OB-fold protein
VEEIMTLLERDKNTPKAWYGELPVTSRYTFGLAGERFFRAIKEEGAIYGTCCLKCERTYVPAALFCERCLAELDDWVDVGTIGEIYTFTLLYKNYDGSRREVPELIAFISIGDGGIIHRVGGIDPEDVEIGMKVQAVFKDKSDREGSILDIVYFKPVST